MFVYVKAQLSVSEREIQEMIGQRIRKMEEIRTSVAELEVGHTHNIHIQTLVNQFTLSSSIYQTWNQTLTLTLIPSCCRYLASLLSGFHLTCLVKVKACLDVLEAWKYL